ncbi:pseudouridine synthase [Stachybotrys elegans]|uniref:Pseudouridine synthase n=1 Tax=Stachybotrys elegans TaxID=80388 RepID=A0A8K0T5I1_9HYPO|nr:pseudouridine synthase [Stachybotrys elegans]
MAEQPHYSVRGSGSRMRSLGITQHVTPLASPWTGELRVRFTDFLVNEIAKDGSVVHLRTIGAGEQKPGDQETKPAVEASEGTQGGQTQTQEEQEPVNDATAEKPAQDEPSMDVSPKDVAILEGLVGQKFTQELVQMFNSANAGPVGRKVTITSEPIEDRSKRGPIHQEIRRIFRSKIDTNTDASGALLASLQPSRRNNHNKQRGRGGGRGRDEEKPAGEYLHFTLFKDNKDTMEAVNQLARLLKVKPQVISYAGTKDRRASTAQRCSVRYMRPRSLASANSKLWGVVTGDYEYKSESMYLGQLLGNEFTITIKKCQVASEPSLPVDQRLDKIRATVEPALAHMAQHGWINYFGHQRFGTHQIGTHEIGKLILGGKFKEAVHSLLSYNPEIADKAERGEIPSDATGRDDYARNHACMLFMTGKDIEKAAKIIPRRFAAEACVLRQLTRQGRQSMNDHIGAIIHITRGLRSMYLHAYQSLVWNHAASKRWELYGGKVVKGDLIIIDSADAQQAAKETDQDGQEIITPSDGNNNRNNNDGGEDDDEDAPLRARPLTEEEAASGRHTIYDVVLPVPGYEVLYPDNEIGAFYTSFMGREENGGLDPHNMRRIHREFSLPGRYRKLMNRFLAPPSAEVKAYADDTEQMHPTDLDLVRASIRERKETRKRARAGSSAAEREDDPSKKKPKAAAEEEDKDQEMGEGLPADEEVADAPPLPEANEEAPPVQTKPEKPMDKVAVVVKFQLGKSAYATVALRELMGDPPEDAEAGGA